MKRITFIIFALILFVSVIAFAAKAVGSKPLSSSSADSRDEWEYLVVAGGSTNLTSTSNLSLRKEPAGPFSREAFPLELNLDKLGAKGWELVTVSGSPADPVYYFKRRK
jgi:hypothetical protein